MLLLVGMGVGCDAVAGLCVSGQKLLRVFEEMVYGRFRELEIGSGGVSSLIGLSVKGLLLAGV